MQIYECLNEHRKRTRDILHNPTRVDVVRAGMKRKDADRPRPRYHTPRGAVQDAPGG